MSEHWRGKLTEQELLAEHTSWKVGGPAKQLYRPCDVEDLSLFLQSLPKTERLLWLGLGSNVLIRDDGFAGTVILTLGALKELEILPDHIVRAEAGVACATVARFCARSSLTGAEFLAGVPGTIGGALRMNAGAFGGETWEHVVQVETMDRHGNIHHRKPSDYQIAYREVRGYPDEWFIAGHFQLTPGDKTSAFEKIEQLLDRRSLTQPVGVPSCGSVFRNPPGDYAARLIETAGLKNYRIGGAYVSEKHANFIINDGTATAADVEQLVQYVFEQVVDKHQVYLHREVHVIGDKGLEE